MSGKPQIVDGIEVWLAGAPGSPIKSVTGVPVDISEIRKRHGKENPFIDYDFPAVDSIAIGAIAVKAIEALLTPGAPRTQYKWLRPREISQGLGLSADFAKSRKDEIEYYAHKNTWAMNFTSSSDVQQGQLLDCWYLSAVQALPKDVNKVKFVIPADNMFTFSDEKYTGAFHFRFYHMDHCKWVDIVVDDLLPCHLKDGKWVPVFADPVLMDTTKVTEFWPCLIEKAYAKFVGNYGKIEGGIQGQALENLTGGFCELITLHEDLITDDDEVYEAIIKGVGSYNKPVDMYDMIKEMVLQYLHLGTVFIGVDSFNPEARGNISAYDHGALEGYSKVAEGGQLYGFKLENNKIVVDKSKQGLGLVGPHAYTLQDAVEVTTKSDGQMHFLLKLRNPFGKVEWRGAFSDKDEMNWAQVDDKVKERLRKKDADTGSADIDDGTFWIDLKDVLKYFQMVEFCVYSIDRFMQMSYIKGEFPVTFQQPELPTYNDAPLFIFEAKANEQGQCAYIASLIINNYYSKMRLSVFFELRKIPNNDLTVSSSKLFNAETHRHFSPVSVGREASHSELLEPGWYMIVAMLDAIPNKNPKTGELVPQVPKHLEGKPIPFTIRLFTFGNSELKPFYPKFDGKYALQEGAPKDKGHDRSSGCIVM